MMNSLGRYMIRGNNKAEIQKLFNEIINDFNPEDMITISVEHKSDQEALVQELTRQGIII